MVVTLLVLIFIVLLIGGDNFIRLLGFALKAALWIAIVGAIILVMASYA